MVSLGLRSDLAEARHNRHHNSMEQQSGLYPLQSVNLRSLNQAIAMRQSQNINHYQTSSV